MCYIEATWYLEVMVTLMCCCSLSIYLSISTSTSISISVSISISISIYIYSCVLKSLNNNILGGLKLTQVLMWFHYRSCKTRSSWWRLCLQSGVGLWCTAFIYGDHWSRCLKLMSRVLKLCLEMQCLWTWWHPHTSRDLKTSQVVTSVDNRSHLKYATLQNWDIDTALLCMQHST